MYNDSGWWGRMVMGDGSGKVGLWSYRVLAPRSLPLPSFLTFCGHLVAAFTLPAHGLQHRGHTAVDQ